MGAEVPQNLIDKLEEMRRTVAALDEQLADPAVASNPGKLRELSIRRAALARIVEQYARYRSLREEAEELRRSLDSESDAEYAELARGEIQQLEQQASELIEKIQEDLVTADDRAIGAVVMELRAGVGGDEAALWAGDLLAMYQRFAQERGWTFDVIELSPGEVGGVKSALVSIEGEGVWAELGYEGGTHCVKRVPATETQGRVHTSTATVAVLPEPSDVEVEIDENDVQVHVTTSQGPGGQNVNKVATAVHLLHEPTGIEVRIQESKSQRQNRERAWQVLRARLYEQQRQQWEQERQEARVAMIGRGGRAERVRTYRYKEGIVVDHRISGKNYPLQGVLAGQIDELVRDLTEHDVAERLAAL
jgi:peptide chain release factor 1